MVQARYALGGVSQDQVRSALHAQPQAPNEQAPDEDVAGRRVVAPVQDHRATWTVWHLRAEAERQLRTVRVATATERDALVDRVVTAALRTSVALTVPPAEATSPQALTRQDGESVFAVHGADRFTSKAILDAEAHLVDAARTPTVPHITAPAAHRGMASADLDPGQGKLVRRPRSHTDPRGQAHRRHPSTASNARTAATPAAVTAFASPFWA